MIKKYCFEQLSEDSFLLLKYAKRFSVPPLRFPMHMVLAYGVPSTFRKDWTCMAQTNETSAFARKSSSLGRNPTTNNSAISTPSTSCLQWNLGLL